MAEKVLALVDYLAGDDCILSSLTTHIRGQGRSKDLPHGYLPLHGDDPHPHAGFNNSVTVNICLTDVTEESGSLAFVPGSHKRTRQPTPQERVLTGNDANPEAVPLVALAGSAVIWPSHTWHGSWESPTPGLRSPWRCFTSDHICSRMSFTGSPFRTRCSSETHRVSPP